MAVRGKKSAVVAYLCNTWNRVKKFVVFLHTGLLRKIQTMLTTVFKPLAGLLKGGFSAADWSIQENESHRTDAKISSSASAVQLSSSIICDRKQLRSVFEYRDLCRIISSFIPTRTINRHI